MPENILNYLENIYDIKKINKILASMDFENLSFTALERLLAIMASKKNKLFEYKLNIHLKKVKTSPSNLALARFLLLFSKLRQARDLKSLSDLTENYPSLTEINYLLNSLSLEKREFYKSKLRQIIDKQTKNKLLLDEKESQKIYKSDIKALEKEIKSILYQNIKRSNQELISLLNECLENDEEMAISQFLNIANVKSSISKEYNLFLSYLIPEYFILLKRSFPNLDLFAILKRLNPEYFLAINERINYLIQDLGLNDEDIPIFNGNIIEKITKKITYYYNLVNLRKNNLLLHKEND